MTRERAPFEWAKIQSYLGGALETLGQREGGTRRLAEAVAACDAALEVFEATTADYQIKICRMNRAATRALLAERKI
jgi:hypothetical protein